jgi:hypothetical protein
MRLDTEMPDEIVSQNRSGQSIDVPEPDAEF